MEADDGLPDGSPGEWTFRRYCRYAEGGSGLIWFEATSIVPEGRSNPHQLMLNRKTLDGFKRLVERARQASQRALRINHDPYLVLQLTHSGRFSKPEGKSLGKTACLNPYLDEPDEALTLFSDEELDRLKNTFTEVIGLAYEAGFDAVDIKACHGYLLHELLGARTRADSRYGGSLENRARFIIDCVQIARRDHPRIAVAVRLSATDGIPYPCGFGMADDGSDRIDLSEPKRLIRQLIEAGCRLLNITAGIPLVFPHISRPYNRPMGGSDRPKEHPLEGVVRLINLAGDLQREFPLVPLVSSGYSWLRQFWPHVGAAVIQEGKASFIGLGRSSFAYPEAPRDLMTTGKIDPRKSCISCSRCSELLRRGRPSGCAVRDREIYAEEYRKMEKSV
jgi:2,4-dienoyl-CoA reductase-like NADH-dependent reductase (Old Yellow Enzyme family)